MARDGCLCTGTDHSSTDGEHSLPYVLLLIHFDPFFQHFVPYISSC